MRGDWYQLSLIFLGVIVTALFGVFLYREIFPEYKIYQNAYVKLEEFRSQSTESSPPPFSFGVKQILIDKGYGAPPIVDRCTSCHVALQFSHFSPTKVATDINGSPQYNEKGEFVLESNDEYIWKQVDQQVAKYRSEGNNQEAERLLSWKTAKVGDHVYDMTKVLRAHPLMGRETRPFEYHPIEEYGCTVCHSGNGRALTTDKAHGALFDGEYEEEFTGHEFKFTEEDLANDPPFARLFNHKPGHNLLFQTSPLFLGALIEANCIQCHSSAQVRLEESAKEIESLKAQQLSLHRITEQSYLNEKKALDSLLKLYHSLKNEGFEKTKKNIEANSVDFSLSKEEISSAAAQLAFLNSNRNQITSLQAIERGIGEKVGKELKNELLSLQQDSVETFLEQHKEKGEAGSLFQKRDLLEKSSNQIEKVKKIGMEFNGSEDNNSFKTSLMPHYYQGEFLFFSQACYACHRIDGLSRGGVGPELTNEGEKYPWFIKESIVWPQADLKTSVMPNFRLDHSEIEDLMTFLLAQKGRERKTSETSYKSKLLEWEAGYRLPWERPINPGKLDNLDYGMEVFATEGCAACHRLKGYTSDVGFSVEKEEGSPSFEKLYAEREWFQKLIPEEILGSELVTILENHGEEIDERIVNDVRTGSLLEELEKEHPALIESFNGIFHYAERAKNHVFEEIAKGSSNQEVKNQALIEQKKWQDRVRRVLLMYVQEYGLGRLIGPRPNWSGIYRSDEWLIEHFRKPSRHTAKSIMPVMPFDDSKFYLLTYMLDTIAQKNREEVRQIWDHRGFDPEQAYQIHCAQCHGAYLHGNGPVSQWIYPIPKNLRNGAFLRNLTRENVVDSILHGVKGTPMPPWGEVAHDKLHASKMAVITEHEAVQMVDWLFASLLGGTVIRSDKDVEKWHYLPKDAVEELKAEGNLLQPGPPPKVLEFEEVKPEEVNKENSIKEKGSKVRVEEVFDITSSSKETPQKSTYHIKKKYYTKENLLAGQQFFELNCAVCHGKEADGQGYRAGTMFDAKPRMLTNLHWLDTRDDLRLLRSIKYGVPGTSMTPWGDQTSSLQRMQLVMFLRSLSIEQDERDALFNAIYETYDVSDQQIEMARIHEYTTVNSIQDELNQLNEKEEILQKSEDANEALSLYKKRIELMQLLTQSKAADQRLLDIKQLVKEEGQIYQNIGVLLVGKPPLEKVFQRYLELIGSTPHYTQKEGKLLMDLTQDREDEMNHIVKQIIQRIQQEITSLEKEMEDVSPDKKDELENIKRSLKSFNSLKNAFVSGSEEAKRLRQRQRDLMQKGQRNL